MELEEARIKLKDLVEKTLENYKEVKESQIIENIVEMLRKRWERSGTVISEYSYNKETDILTLKLEANLKYIQVKFSIDTGTGETTLL